MSKRFFARYVVLAVEDEHGNLVAEDLNTTVGHKIVKPHTFTIFRTVQIAESLDNIVDSISQV